jgi:hypothetical protein
MEKYNALRQRLKFNAIFEVKTFLLLIYIYFILVNTEINRCIFCVQYCHKNVCTVLLLVVIDQKALALMPRTYHLMPTVEHLLLECPIRACHPQVECSDWTLQQPVFHCWHQVISTWQQGKCVYDVKIC